MSSAGLERTFVCLPTIGILALWIVRFRLGRPVVVLFDNYPSYGKALIRWLKVPEKWLVGFFSTVTGMPLKKMTAADTQGGSVRLNLEFMRRVTDILIAMRPKLERAGWVQALARTIGDEPALAYYHRTFPWHDIWSMMAPAAVSRWAAGEDGKLVLVWSPTWPLDWQAVLNKQLAEYQIALFRWPAWFLGTYGAFAQIIWTARVYLTVVLFVARHGLRRGTTRESVVACIEFIEASRLGGGPNDTNFIEDGSHIRRDDILYFLTRDHADFCKRAGLDTQAMVREARASGFRVQELSNLGYALGTLRWFVVELFRLAAGCWRLGPPCLAAAYWRAWRDIMTQSVLFDSYRPRNYMHTECPNGNTGGRFQSAIVTALCRRHGCRSVGFQNRSIYDRVFEDCFDCYDLYLAWGPAWRKVLDPGNEFIRQIASVGCLHNEGLKHFTEALPRAIDQPVVVSIFSGDLDGTMYTPATTLNLLITCMHLADRHPECHFQVKLKDPEHLGVLLRDALFSEENARARPNFVFLQRRRHDCASAIAESDIVISASSTTPGFDAVVLGKRVLFYDEAGVGGQALAGLPHTMARSTAQLMEFFELAIGDYTHYVQTHQAALRELDPFRDGMVRQRMRKLLLGGLDDESGRQDRIAQVNGKPTRQQVEADLACGEAWESTAKRFHVVNGVGATTAE